MPAYKDEERGTWYVKFYYTDWTGKRKSKFKRGFERKKDAQQFEHEFKAKNEKTKSCDMPFHVLAQKWMEYSKNVKRNRLGTLKNKQDILDHQILPYFRDQPVDSITASDIIEWQAELMSTTDENDIAYRPTYLRTLNSKLSQIFNYAVTFHNLPINPCKQAGYMGSKDPETVDFWTLDEYRQFIPYTKDKPRAKVGLEILYWGGLRIGEMLALTPADYDPTRRGVNISKTWYVIDGEEVIGPPKSKKGYRFVELPEFVCEELEQYMNMLYECPDDERIFYSTTSSLFKSVIDKRSVAAGVKRIRVHDLRHSHVSLLIHLGYDYMAIADRIGDSVAYVINTYGHLYPEKRQEIPQRLNELEESARREAIVDGAENIINFRIP